MCYVHKCCKIRDGGYAHEFAVTRQWPLLTTDRYKSETICFVSFCPYSVVKSWLILYFVLLHPEFYVILRKICLLFVAISLLQCFITLSVILTFLLMIGKVCKCLCGYLSPNGKERHWLSLKANRIAWLLCREYWYLTVPFNSLICHA